MRPIGPVRRSSAAELLPDPLSPLFATLALPLWNEALQAKMKALVHAGAGGARNLAISPRISTNNFLGTATSAIWKVT